MRPIDLLKRQSKLNSEHPEVIKYLMEIKEKYSEEGVDSLYKKYLLLINGKDKDYEEIYKFIFHDLEDIVSNQYNKSDFHKDFLLDNNNNIKTPEVNFKDIDCSKIAKKELPLKIEYYAGRIRLKENATLCYELKVLLNISSDLFENLIAHLACRHCKPTSTKTFLFIATLKKSCKLNKLTKDMWEMFKVYDVAKHKMLEKANYLYSETSDVKSKNLSRNEEELKKVFELVAKKNKNKKYVNLEEFHKDVAEKTKKEKMNYKITEDGNEKYGYGLGYIDRKYSDIFNLKEKDELLPRYYNRKSNKR